MYVSSGQTMQSGVQEIVKHNELKGDADLGEEAGALAGPGGSAHPRCHHCCSHKLQECSAPC